MPVVGLSGTSFGNGGSFSVRAGNTTMGKADGEAKRPDEVEPLPGVPTFRLDRRPRQLGDCSIDYPEELKRDEITGDVILGNSGPGNWSRRECSHQRTSTPSPRPKGGSSNEALSILAPTRSR